MPQNISIPFDQFANAMVKIGALGSPSGLHGWLTGYLSSGARLSNDEWQREAEDYLETPEAVPQAVRSLMTVFYGWVLEGLQDEGMAFTLFLPDEDDADLTARVTSFAQWSKGFLDGFGASGVVKGIPDKEIVEVLEHFDAFSQADLALDEADEESEGIFLELSEHARVAALTVFLAFNQPATGPASAPEQDTRKLH